MTTIIDELITFLKSVRLADLFSNPYFNWPYQGHFKLNYLNHQVSLMCSLSNNNMQNKTIKFGQMIYNKDIYFIEKEFDISIELVIEPENNYYILIVKNENNLAHTETTYAIKKDQDRVTVYDLLQKVDDMIPLTSNLKNFKLEDYSNEKFFLNPDFFTDSQSMILIEAMFI